MKIFGSEQAAHRLCRKAEKLVLVPTMGALHAGHAALIDRARRAAGRSGTVAVSIFVNPTQFGPAEDFSRYPRPFDADAALCRRHGVDVLFHPPAEAMYPAGFSTAIHESALSPLLCGASRPGHFSGVCTVVAKLFHILSPRAAVFGMKDFQQLAIIRKMTADLNFPVEIIAVETVREKDGLALSSRNQYLTAQERAQAPIIRNTLLRAGELLRSGKKGPAALKAWMAREIARAPLARIDYLEIVDPHTLQPVPRAGGACLLAAAVFFGRTRLIDNLLVENK